MLTDMDLQMPGTYREEPPPVIPSTEPTPQPRRTRRAPARFHDVLPEPAQPISAPPPQLPTVYLMVTDPLKTALNSFGVFRQYLFHPSYDPDSSVDPRDLSNLSMPVPPPPPPPPSPHSEVTSHAPPWPFANMSIWKVMNWMNTGSNSKSEGEVDRLVNEVLTAPDFCPKDLETFKSHRENARLDAANRTDPLEDGFMSATITIEVPAGQPTDPSATRTFPVEGLRYRNLLNVIKAAFQDPLSRKFHFTPFKLMRRSQITEEEQRVYSELYNSDEFINEYKRVQNRSPNPPDDPGCKLEKVIAALMFWSDSTHLTNFGIAKLWPIYLFFGNLSKYIRSRPSSGACNHLAYIPSVRIPDDFTMYGFTYLFYSFQIHSKVGFQAGTHAGIPSVASSWLTADVSFCRLFGNIFSTMISFTP